MVPLVQVLLALAVIETIHSAYALIELLYVCAPAADFKCVWGKTYLYIYQVCEF